jgi:hypothetical protein
VPNRAHGKPILCKFENEKLSATIERLVFKAEDYVYSCGFENSGDTGYKPAPAMKNQR